MNTNTDTNALHQSKATTVVTVVHVGHQTYSILVTLSTKGLTMKYNLIISYPDGHYHLWNKMSGNEWEITFEYESQMFNFMYMLLQETTQ